MLSGLRVLIAWYNVLGREKCGERVFVIGMEMMARARVISTGQGLYMRRITSGDLAIRLLLDQSEVNPDHARQLVASIEQSSLM